MQDIEELRRLELRRLAALLRWVAAVFVLISITVMIVGIAGMFIPHEPAKKSAAVELTPAERESGLLLVSTVPIEIRLRILPRQAFTRDPVAVAGYKTLAFSVSSRTPCEIAIPEGWEIMVWPSKGKAEWLSPSDGDTLAHEIAHCLRGRWHPNTAAGQ